MVMIQVFNCTNTREYTNIPSCMGKLVSNSSCLEEGRVFTLVKLYNKANLISEVPGTILSAHASPVRII